MPACHTALHPFDHRSHADHAAGQADGRQLRAYRGPVQRQATEYTTTIPVLVFKWFQGNKFSESTALGLFQSVIGVILVVASDKIAKKLGEDGLL